MRRYLGAALLLLTGCMVGPDYQRPQLEVPTSYQYKIADAATTANSAWWRLFNDPVLDALIEEALGGNLDVRIAAANIERAAGVFTTVRSPLLPQIGYEGNAGRQRLPDQLVSPGASNTDNAYQAFAGASWEIDLWGRIRRQTEAARANLFATEEARRGVVLSLVASVAQTYLRLRAFDEQLVITERTRDNYAASLKLFELQYKYGVVSEMTVEQSRSQYQSALVTEAQVRQQIVVLENALSILLGRNPGPVARGKPIAEVATPEVPSGLPSDLLVQRPDVMEAEQNLIAANARIGAARALYYPSISLTGIFGGTSQDLSELFDSQSRTWNYTGSVIGPIFSGGAISGLVAESEAVRKAALANYQATVQRAFADVENALSARQKLSDQLLASEGLVRALQEYARLARLQYDEGYASFLTVLDAEQSLFPAELELARTRAAVLNSVTDIYRAMGGGWITQAAELAPQPVEGGWLSPSLSSQSQ